MYYTTEQALERPMQCENGKQRNAPGCAEGVVALRKQIGAEHNGGDRSGRRLLYILPIIGHRSLGT